MFGNALHSRHIRGAYNRRRDEETKTNVLKRSHSSHARLNDEKCDVKHHQHPHHNHVREQHHGKDQHAHHHLHERPVFALSLDQERDALNHVEYPVRKHGHRSSSAPELGFEHALKQVNTEVADSPLSPLPQPDQWRWDFGSAFRRFDTLTVSSTGIRQSLLDAIQTFGAAPNH